MSTKLNKIKAEWGLSEFTLSKGSCLSEELQHLSTKMVTIERKTKGQPNRVFTVPEALLIAYAKHWAAQKLGKILIGDE